MRSKAINIDSVRQEITKKISGFPISCYHSAFSDSTYDCIDWHWHVDLQLCVTLTGTVVWSTESQLTPVPEGGGIFINSQRVHMARPHKGREASYFCVIFPPDFLCSAGPNGLFDQRVRPILEQSGLPMKVIDRKTRPGAEILDRLSEMSEVFDAGHEGYEFELAAGVLLLWKRLYALLKDEIRDNPGQTDTRFRRMLLYLQNHYASPVSLEEIASAIGLSRSECCRYFKKQAGQTMFDYLTQYRVHRSMDLLSDTDLSIAQIAQDCGFSNQSYYAKRFRELIGITPKQYRMRNVYLEVSREGVLNKRGVK